MSPEELDAGLKLAASLVEQGRGEEATRALLGLPTGSAVTWDNLLDAAKLARKAGELALCRKLAESAVEACPECPEPLRLMGSWCQDDGELKEAAGFLRAAAIKDSTSASRVLLGWVEWDLGNDGSARSSFEEAIKLDPSDDEAWYGLGSTKRFRVPTEALDDFRRARSLDAANAAAWREEGLCLARIAQPGPALDCLRRAIALEPTDAWAHEGLAAVLSREGSDGDAVPALERAIELDPSQALFRVHLGSALGRLGRTDEARPHFLAALEISPDGFLPNLRFGQLLMGTGETSEAIRYLSRAVQIEPEDKRARDALRAASEGAGAHPRDEH